MSRRCRCVVPYNPVEIRRINEIIDTHCHMLHETTPLFFLITVFYLYKALLFLRYYVSNFHLQKIQCLSRTHSKLFSLIMYIKILMLHIFLSFTFSESDRYQPVKAVSNLWVLSMPHFLFLIDELPVYGCWNGSVLRYCCGMS